MVFAARRRYASVVLGVVILSVCHTRALWLIQRTYRRSFYTTWKGNPSSQMWFFVQLCSSWQDFNWLKGSRGLSAAAELLITSPVRAVEKYCDEHVCLSVCLSVYPRAYLRSHTRDLYQILCTLPWQWLGPPPAGWQYPKGRGNFGGFPRHWQCIVTRSLQMGSAGKEVIGVDSAGEV